MGAYVALQTATALGVPDIGFEIGGPNIDAHEDLQAATALGVSDRGSQVGVPDIGAHVTLQTTTALEEPGIGADLASHTATTVAALGIEFIARENKKPHKCTSSPMAPQALHISMVSGSNT